MRQSTHRAPGWIWRSSAAKVATHTKNASTEGLPHILEKKKGIHHTRRTVTVVEATGHAPNILRKKKVFIFPANGVTHKKAHPQRGGGSSYFGEKKRHSLH
jgi:hypothetical protein